MLGCIATAMIVALTAFIVLRGDSERDPEVVRAVAATRAPTPAPPEAPTPGDAPDPEQAASPPPGPARSAEGSALEGETELAGLPLVRAFDPEPGMDPRTRIRRYLAEDRMDLALFEPFLQEILAVEGDRALPELLDWMLEWAVTIPGSGKMFQRLLEGREDPRIGPRAREAIAAMHEAGEVWDETLRPYYGLIAAGGARSDQEYLRSALQNEDADGVAAAAALTLLGERGAAQDFVDLVQRDDFSLAQRRAIADGLAALPGGFQALYPLSQDRTLPISLRTRLLQSLAQQELSAAQLEEFLAPFWQEENPAQRELIAQSLPQLMHNRSLETRWLLRLVEPVIVEELRAGDGAGWKSILPFLRSTTRLHTRGVAGALEQRLAEQETEWARAEVQAALERVRQTLRTGS